MPKAWSGDVLLLSLYFGEVSYLHVVAHLCHVTTLLCHVKDHTTIAPSLVLILGGYKT